MATSTTRPPTAVEPEDLGRLAIERRVLTPRQLADCQKLVQTVKERFHLTFTLGQVILERVYASNPKTRPILSRAGGVQEILGPGIHVDLLKLPKAAHDRLLERVERGGLVPPEKLREAAFLQEELAKLGIVKRLGEILILRGHVARALADECLRPPPELAKLPAFAFARIAVHNGLISERDASDALELADQVAEELGLRLPIGQVFYEMGVLRRREVEAILQAQVEMGRIRPEEARIRCLKTTEAERERLHRRLVEDGHVEEAAWTEAVETARRLSSHGLELDPVEVLWVRDRIPEAAISDVLEFQAESFARLDPETPNLSVSVAPSAEWLARQRPKDLPEADFLYGQFALVAGAIQREELDWAVNAVRRLRQEFGPGYTLERALLDRYKNDVGRLRLLEKARRELARFQGRACPPPRLPLSPVEKELVREIIERGDVWTEEQVGQAITRIWLLAEMGIEKDVTELLVEEPTTSGRPGWDVVPGRDDVSQKLIGAWRRPRTEVGLERALFERAFTKSADWGTNHLGTLALEAGLLTQAQLVEALHAQIQIRELGLVKPFGEILVEKGFLTPEELANTLQLQSKRLARIQSETELPESDDLGGEDEPLFRRIRDLGVLSQDSLRDALRIRRQLQSLGLKGSLKEILIRKGYLDSDLIAGLLVPEGVDERVTQRLRAVRKAGGITTAIRIQDAYARSLQEGEPAGPAPVEPTPRRPAAIAPRVAILGVGAGLGILGWLVAKAILGILD